MRPITLTMQAFGSYGRKTSIDFTRANQNLFLVTGDTGAGKTTIFDALVFALYGEASSGENKKDGAELQSQFAEPEVEPFVELTFSEVTGGAEQRYTVRRVPRHRRPMKRGSGMKDEGEKVSLILPEGGEFSQNKKETNEKLEEIVGLTKAQFMQVAMIAQGEFMELLRADSNQKKEIFRKLFHTEIYQDVVEELGRRRKEKSGEMGRIHTICKNEVSHLLLPEEDCGENVARLRELSARIGNSERLNSEDMRQFLEELKVFRETQQSLREEAEQRCARTEEELNRRRAAQTEGETLAGAFLQLEKAGQELAACGALSEEMEEAGRLAARILAAYEVKNRYQRYIDARDTAAAAEEGKKQQEEALPGLTEACQAAADGEKAAQMERDREMSAYTRAAQRVEQALAVLQRIGEAEKAVADGEHRLEQEARSAREAARALEDFDRQVEEWQQESRRLTDADKKLALWQVKKQDCRTIAGELEELELLEQNRALQEKKVTEARRAYERARTAAAEKNGAYMAAQNGFLDAQAGFLAREKLRPGAPCPVCGSLEHPHPCTLSDEHRELTREYVEGLAAENAALQKEQAAAATSARAAGELLEERKQNFLAAHEKLRSRLREQLPEAELTEQTGCARMKSLLEEYDRELEQRGGRLQQAVRKLKQLQTALEQAGDRKLALKREAEQAERRRVEAQTALAAGRQTCQELLAQRDYPSAEAAGEALALAARSRDEKNALYEAAHSKALRAGTEMENARALMERYAGELPGRQKARDDRREEYVALLREKGLTEEEWQAVSDAHAYAEAEALQRRVEGYRKRKATAEGSLTAARTAIGDRQKPDMEQLRAAVLAGEEEKKREKLALEQRKEYCTAAGRILSALEPKMEERGGLAREFARIDGLYRRLSGNVTGGRMDIETFVQRYHLKRILYAANQRFRDMSAGQFELRIIGEEQAGVGRNKGLDLMVYSTVTGKEREVRTLSGGESFMAALSLALGMADQIQESSSAIHLDIMFIDEGFGSLDEHSRNQAVRVLQRMAGGSRLIGIISHVTELKQEIEDQLLVTKDKTGSHVTWQIS